MDAADPVDGLLPPLGVHVSDGAGVGEDEGLEILNVLCDLRDRTGFSALLITHDLAVARHVCDRIGVMWQGRLVEEGPVEQVITQPAHEYTRALLKAADA